MLTYSLKKQPGVPLYEALYRCIRADILNGTLRAGEKLPSQRALAAHLEVSKITVEGAYAQLLAEGFISSKEKVGYFVEAVAQPTRFEAVSYHEPEEPAAKLVDLTGGGSTNFPFSVWSRLQRQVMLDYGEQLLQPLPNQGLYSLRQAISRHLAAFRGMQVSPENILIGAGTDFLYNLLIQLLGRDKCYAVEDPGYGKILKIYAAAGASCTLVGMDGAGPIPSELSQAQVLHISPSHHFPTGQICPMQRRRELLSWAAQGERWIIEDDYDSEFRFNARPMSTMYALDGGNRVIYINTFSKTLAPSIRISFLVLPGELMKRLQSTLGFYGCTVPSFEQYTLERFLSQGYFEKHINRMRRIYRSRRDRLVAMLKSSPIADKITILEQDAGLHFLLRVDAKLADTALWERAGILIYPLSRYYHSPAPEDAQRQLVVNYDRLTDEEMDKLAQCLKQL